MRKTTVARGLLFLGIAGLAGCANSDYAQSRKTREGVTINGSQFAPAEENDQNAFGRESDGLSTNPKTKPSKEDLGEAGKLCSNKSSLTGDPVGVDAFVNEVVDVKFVLKGVANTRSGCDGEEEPDGLKGVRVVIVLERPDGADGVIDIVDSNANPVEKKTATKIIANTDTNGEVHVRLYTGSMYSKNNAMYYINAWQADVEMAAIKVKINKLPQKSDGDFFDGNKDTANDLTPPPGYSDIVSGKAFVEIVNEDPLKQELFVGGKKRLRVKLLGAAEATSKTFSEAANEGICWKFVSKRVKSSGHLEGNSARAVEVMDGEIKDQAGCSKTDATGAFWVEIDTGSYYNERYFLNFFHPKATPISYQIDTFIAPDTLGEQGNDAEITTTVGGKDKIDSFDQGEFSEKETKDLIDKIFGTDACTEPVRSIYEQCYDPQCTFNCKNGLGTADCPKDGFICKFKKNPDGTWSIIDKDGKLVKADLNGDCNCNDTEYTPDLKCSLPESETCNKGVCKGSGKACLDDINVVLDKGKDGKTIENKGVDTDGDGKVDVAPDECAATDPLPPECKSEYRFVWSDDSKQHFYNQKLSTPIGEEFPVYVKARNKITSAPNPNEIPGVTATLIRGSYPSNDAMLRVGSKDVENMAFTIDAGKEATLNFWSGKAFGALYYIQLRHKDVMPANIPIATSNVINMPSGEGDSPDDSVLQEGGEAVTPPSDMGKPDPNLGHCTLFVDPDEVEQVKNANGDALLTMTGEALKNNQSLTTSSIETPIARTLVLNAALVCDRGSKLPSIVKNVKTYWKLTRGKSTYNNGTLLSTVKATDYTGVASSQFYAGTGYGATYYVSVFHPNATQDASCKKDCKTRPAVFEIKVNDSKGSIPGPSEKDDPILPGDTTGTDKDGNKGICCNTANAESLGVCDPNPCTEEAVNCNDALKRTYIYCDKDKGTETHGEKPDVNKSLPTVACNVADFPDCLKDSGECPDFAGNVIGEDDGDPTKKFVAGCMLLSFEGDDPLRSYIGTLQSVKVKLQQRTLNGIESVADTVYVTANKAPEADGAFTSDKQRTSSKHGTTVFFFKTGSVITSYKLSVSHPNYVDDTGLMIPVSKMLHIVDKSLLEAGKSDKNILKLSTDASDNGDVFYYVLSNDYNKCDNRFAYKEKPEAKTACEVAQVPAAWKSVKFEKEGGKYYSIKQEMCQRNASEGVAEVQVPNHTSRYMVYAVRFNGNTPMQYGCVDNLYLDKPVCEKVDKIVDGEVVYENGETVKDEVCTSTLDVNVTMEDIPKIIDDRYEIESLMDLGPLIEIPKGCRVENGKLVAPDQCVAGNSAGDINCFLCKIQGFYNYYIGQNPGEKIVSQIEKFFLPKELLENPGENEGCMSIYGFGNFVGNKDVLDESGKPKIDDKTGKPIKENACKPNGSFYSDISSTAHQQCCIEKECFSFNPTNYDGGIFNSSGECRPAYNANTCTNCVEHFKGKDITVKRIYKNSDCICGKVYHWTAGKDRCDTCFKFGDKARDLLVSLLTKLVNKAFTKVALEDNMCKLIDSVQFIKLKGTIDFDRKAGLNNMATTLRFTGGQLPYLNEDIDIGPTVKGTATGASLGTDTVIIPSMALQLSYGQLVMSLIGRLLPEGAIDEKTYEIELGSIVKCSTLFGLKNGLKIPLTSIKIDASVIDALCATALKGLDTKINGLAEQQYLSLHMNLAGSGKLTSSASTCDDGQGLCAHGIENGLWSGRGKLKSTEVAMSGLWVAAKEGRTMPELSYGDKSVEEFMAEHSVCRKLLSEAESEPLGNYPTNKDCLGGSFDNPNARISNHKCSDEKCNQLGIVVCKDNQLNALYANASAAEIIKAANDACKPYASSQKDACKMNPEIVNWGKGVTNEECITSYTDACKDNPSIVVVENGTDVNYNTEACECKADPSCKEGDGTVCVVDGDVTYKCTKSQLSECINKACTGQCNEPGCIMNSEVKACKDTEDSTEVVEKPQQAVAIWDFSNITKTNEIVDKMVHPKNTEGNEVESLKLAFVNTGCDNLKEKVAMLKLVQGKDGKVGALGTDAFVSQCDSAMKEDYRAGTFVITGSITDKKITKVTFNVMGAGREISFGKGSAPSKSSTTFISSDTLWENKELVFETPVSSLNMHIAPIGNGDVGMKAMRLDDIIVYAQ